MSTRIINGVAVSEFEFEVIASQLKANAPEGWDANTALNVAALIEMLSQQNEWDFALRLNQDMKPWLWLRHDERHEYAIPVYASTDGETLAISVLDCAMQFLYLVPVREREEIIGIDVFAS